MRALLIIAVTASLASSGCARQPAADADAVLREHALIVLEKHCGRCHIGTYESALPRALAIFDLTDPDSFTRLSDAQLASAQGRIDAPFDLEGEPSTVTAEERSVIAAFIAHERARRAK